MIGCGEAAEEAAGEGDPVRVVDQPVDDGIAKRGVPDTGVPVFCGVLIVSITAARRSASAASSSCAGGWLTPEVSVNGAPRLRVPRNRGPRSPATNGRWKSLQPAWLDIRLALERLYTLVRAKHGTANFDVRTWSNHTAEAMWEEGVGALVLARVSDAGPRLKDILDMTAAGAHDKPARGETDLRDATAYVRQILRPLRVGG